MYKVKPKKEILRKNEKYEEFHKSTHIQRKIIKKNNFTYRTTIEIMEGYLTNKNNLLDIGCGAGTVDLFFAKKGYKVQGIDISKNAIESANESAKYLNLRMAKFNVLNFPKEIPKSKYNAILCSEVIEHITNDRLAVKKMYNLLHKEGILIISTPSKNAPLYKLGLLKAFDDRVGHLRRYTAEELKILIEDAGLEVIYIQKTEGILRNFLFTNKIAGKSVRFIKFFLSDFITAIDNVLLKVFGESNIYVVARKSI